jgi:hypothetical protein
MTEPAVSLVRCSSCSSWPVESRRPFLYQTFTRVAVVFLENSFVFPSRRLLLVRWVSAVTSRRRTDGAWCRDLHPRITATETALKLSENEEEQRSVFTQRLRALYGPGTKACRKKKRARKLTPHGAIQSSLLSEVPTWLVHPSQVFKVATAFMATKVSVREGVRFRRPRANLDWLGLGLDKGHRAPEKYGPPRSTKLQKIFVTFLNYCCGPIYLLKLKN